MMTLLELLKEPSLWETYFSYQTGSDNSISRLTKAEQKDLRHYIEQQEYLPVLDRILLKKPLSIPVKRQISKTDSQKTRDVYLFPREENYVLKALTFVLIRRYAYLFSDNLYSFREGYSAKDAIHSFSSIRNISQKYCYKVDIRNYFNSIPIPLLLPMLQDIFKDDSLLYHLFSSMLLEKRVCSHGEIIEEEKGIMAGTPTAAFLANIYLSSLDHYFLKKQVPYARYSDDIILFADSAEERDHYADFIHQFLKEKGLSVNPKKEFCADPGDPWVFLGFEYQNGTIDISPASRDKLKGKMRRKARSILRWMRKKQNQGRNVTNAMAAKAYIKAFNAKLYENRNKNDITWCTWYFPVINTTRTLEELDHYYQDCIRFVATEKRTKGRFSFTYEDMKALGSRSLVNEYYKIKTGTKKKTPSDSDSTVSDPDV